MGPMAILVRTIELYSALGINVGVKPATIFFELQSVQIANMSPETGTRINDGYFDKAAKVALFSNVIVHCRNPSKKMVRFLGPIT